MWWCPGGARREGGGMLKTVVAVGALMGGLLATPLAGGAATTSVGTPAIGSVGYAIGEPICGFPSPGHSSCFSMRRVVVDRGTPGARPFVVGDGTTADAVTAGPAATIGPEGGLTPSDLASAYGFSSTATGSGQTVAIVDAFNDPNIDSDLQVFDKQYGLATCSTANGCLKVVNQSGTASPLPPNDTSGWSVEESLDVETVHSVCQKCKIILTEATSAANTNLGDAVQTAATKLHATEISNSYGSPESTTEQSEYNHPGIVITASAGDDGYYDFDLLGGDGNISKPNTPAAFPSVVAVGGTSLYLGQTATRQSEGVWNDDGVKGYDEELLGQRLGAGGGGCSTLFTAPSWQTSTAKWSQTGCGTHRLVNDVAADADYLTGFDIYHTYNCGNACKPLKWETIGGTSLASPIIAAMYALAGGAHGVADPASTLYEHLGDSADLYDVTAGGNGFCDGEGAAACGDWNKAGAGDIDCDYTASGTLNAGDRACDALSGYDGPTGVGTPNGLGAFKP